MTGGVNNFGTTIGPLIVSYAIFGDLDGSAAVASIESVKTPYLVLGVAFLLAAILFKFSSLPNKIPTVSETSESSSSGGRKSALSYPQLWLGMIGIFVYVGVEVSTASNMPDFMKQHLTGANGEPFPTEKIAPFVSLYWASLMIGRWTGAVGAFGVEGLTKKVLNFLMPYIAFSVFLLVNLIAKHEVSQFYIYSLVIIVMIIGDLLSKGNPARQLLIFSLMGITALVIGMLSSGMVSVFAFASVGLFCSTLWPCIFTLAVSGLGKHTNEGSGYLIMMIMGGGIISVLQGILADSFLGIQYSFIAGVACFAYLAFYAIRSKKILQAQGIDFDSVTTTGAGH